jgi:hypothetical protein
MLRQNAGFGRDKKNTGLPVDYQTFNLMDNSHNKSFSIPNLTQNKSLCFESTNILSVRKVLSCPKSYNAFTHFLKDDSLNNLKHNDYVFVTIQNNCKMTSFEF